LDGLLRDTRARRTGNEHGDSCRLLVSKEYCLSSLAASVIAICTLLGAFGLETALVQRHDANRSHFDSVSAVNSGFGLCLGLLVAGPSGPPFRLEDALAIEITGRLGLVRSPAVTSGQLYDIAYTTRGQSGRNLNSTKCKQSLHLTDHNPLSFTATPQPCQNCPQVSITALQLLFMNEALGPIASIVLTPVINR